MSPLPRQTKADVVSDFRKHQILDAARESFARDGLARTTVDGIARRAGVAKGTVYLYYQSKAELLRQIVHDDLTELHDDTVSSINAEGTIEEKLQRFFESVLRFFDRKRDFFEHLHFEMSPDVRRKAQQKLEQVFKAQIESWQAALRESDGSRTVDPADGARTIVALASGLAKQHLRGCSAGSIHEVARAATATLWKGLAGR